jgi:hypothetical protein
MERMLNLNLKSDYGKVTCLIAIVICFYYTIIVLFSYNFPISDDLSLVEFVININTSLDLNKKLGLIYAQHNEHRITTTKIIYLLDYWLFDELNFRRLILIGNLFHLGTFYIFIKHEPQIDQRFYLFIFTACMIFQFGSAESMFWSMAAISNYLVLMLALLTLSLLSKNILRYYILAIIFSVLTVFTQGNGILIPLIAVAYLISQNRYRDSLIMAMIALIAILTYFHEYRVPAAHSNPINAIHDLGKILVFAVSFTGSAFGVGGYNYPVLTNFSLITTLTVGALIWTITFYGFYKNIYSNGNIFIWFNLFVILTAIITGVSRINFGLSQSMVSRYHIYSNLAIISTVVLALQLLPIKQYSNHVLHQFFKILAIFSFSYLVVTLVFVPYFYFIVYSPIRSGEIIFPNKDQGLMILHKAKSSGVFSAQ